MEQELDDLASRNGEWLRGSGPDADIVISTRLRLARNLADFPFCNRASELERREIERALRKCSDHLELEEPLRYCNVAKLNPLDRQFLVERQLISREHASGQGARGVVFGVREDVSLMFNEEDHLRIQVIKSGFSIRECWEAIDRMDDCIEAQVRYAFSEEFGYLTACPTNVGTGIRVSVMLHLPGLAMTKEIEKVFRALQKIQLAVRGLYGEGSQASGDFYQISNNVTLGKTEQELISNLEQVVPQILQYERKARRELLGDKTQSLHDRISRAYGVLRTAKTISSEETMHLLSKIRMGVNLNLIDDVGIDKVNALFIHTQPAHLQKIEKQTLDSEERNIARASYLRRQLRASSESPNNN